MTDRVASPAKMPCEGAPRTAGLLSVNVGRTKDVARRGQTVSTGIWKHPVSGPTMIRHLNIDGDGQGGLSGPVAERRAVLVYQIEPYRYWQEYFGRDDFTYGHFGENLPVDALPGEQVCIGDRYRIGEAEFESTKPRVTRFRVANDEWRRVVTQESSAHRCLRRASRTHDRNRRD